MRRRSLADVKAHLSEIVDSIEHRRARVLITRHGKPAAAMVPVAEIRPPAPKPSPDRRRSRAEVERFLDSFGAISDGDDSAVEQLRRDRR